jgi:hypothetical protein
MFQAGLPCPQSKREAGERRWTPLATMETPLELDMLKPLGLDRDGQLDLVIEKANPDDAREHHSRLAQLPPKARGHGCQSVIRDDLSRAHKEHLWPSTALTHPNVMSAWLQTPRCLKGLRELLERMNLRPHKRITTSGSSDIMWRHPRVRDVVLLGRRFQWSMNARSGHVSEGVVSPDLHCVVKVLVHGGFIVC